MSEEPFDVHDHRHRLKQLKDTDDTKLFENRDGVPCPACEEPFCRLFSTRGDSVSFPANDGSQFCLVRTDRYVHVFRH